MKQYIISAIGLYVIFLLLYLLRERILKRRKNAVKNSVFNPFKSAVKENIIGKSRFNLLDHRQSRTQAATSLKPCYQLITSIYICSALLIMQN